MAAITSYKTSAPPATPRTAALRQAVVQVAEQDCFELREGSRNSLATLLQLDEARVGLVLRRVGSWSYGSPLATRQRGAATGDRRSGPWEARRLPWLLGAGVGCLEASPPIVLRGHNMITLRAPSLKQP